MLAAQLRRKLNSGVFQEMETKFEDVAKATRRQTKIETEVQNAEVSVLCVSDKQAW